MAYVICSYCEKKSGLRGKSLSTLNGKGLRFHNISLKGFHSKGSQSNPNLILPVYQNKNGTAAVIDLYPIDVFITI